MSSDSILHQVIDEENTSSSLAVDSALLLLSFMGTAQHIGKQACDTMIPHPCKQSAKPELKKTSICYPLVHESGFARVFLEVSRKYPLLELKMHLVKYYILCPLLHLLSNTAV